MGAPPIYALTKETMSVEQNVGMMRCDVCGTLLPIAAGRANAYEGMPCLCYRCTGRYRQEDECEFFRNAYLYESGEPFRIRTAEHTGLLTKERREKVEKAFKSGEGALDPNLLSCTPTMEMGIDIGGLSAALMCSVPPSTANYKQRVGRAGRKDGNAFLLTTVNDQVNDLYYFHEPESMIRGDIEVPGVFLKAPAILRRQLMAYCLDCQIEEDPKASVPDKLGTCLRFLGSESCFARKLALFVDERREALLEGFMAMLALPAEDEGEVRAAVEAMLSPEGKDTLMMRLQDALRDLRVERKSYVDKRTQLRARKKALKELVVASESDKEELANVEAEIEAYGNLARDLANKPTLEALTDAGALPNYAFPEEGVTLRSIVIKGKSEGGKGRRSHEEGEYVRAAASAITEFAPGNTFYVQGRKLEIDQVVLSSEGDGGGLENWRFCPRCSYMERVDKGADASASCPVCGEQWNDRSQMRDMVRLRQVVATVRDDRSRSLDDKDERTSAFFVRNISVQENPAKESRAWAQETKRTMLAVQYLEGAMFREVNFGEPSPADGADELRMKGAAFSAPGFHMCGKCGKLEKRALQVGPNGQSAMKPVILHAYGCPNRRKKKEPPVTTLCLYREFPSEAVRVVAPDVTNEQAKRSFVAALLLGLRDYFHGNIAHLRTCEDRVEIGNVWRTCIVLYDTIPGGTGYLKELTQDPKTMRKVLQMAYDHLASCSCKDEEGKDGCHRCIYLARETRGRVPSREKAMQTLARLLEGEWEPKELDSLSHAPRNKLLESELEARFWDWLRGDDKKYVAQEQMVDGSRGFLLRTSEKMVWKGRQQVEIGLKELDTFTKPDFLLEPTHAQKSRPIAVFLDGKEFHASEENDKLASDLAKREALRRMGYIVWTLTWDDFENRLREADFYPESNVASAMKKACSAARDWLPAAPLSRVAEAHTLLWLRLLLEEGSAALADAWTAAAGACAIKGKDFKVTPDEVGKMTDALAESGSPEGEGRRSSGSCKGWVLKEAESCWMTVEGEGGGWRKPLDAFRSLSVFACFTAKPEESVAFKRAWRLFWTRYALFQGLEAFQATTPGYGFYEKPAPVATEEEDLLAGVNPQLEELLREMPGVAMPETFCELEPQPGLILPADAYWEDEGVALFAACPDCEEVRAACARMGVKAVFYDSCTAEELRGLLLPD